MEDREEIVSEYFHSWITKDGSNLEKYFSTDTIYSECYGPVYDGIDQMKKWFADWQKRGDVLEWKIKQFVHQNRITVVEWYFKCEYDGKLDASDGVSLIQFNDQNQIVCLKEFQSKAEHHYPYS